MTINSATNYVAITAPFIAGLPGLYKWKKIDIATRIVCICAWFDFLTEAAARYAANRYGNNMPVYAVFSLIEFGLISAYFNFSLQSLRKRKVGIAIGGFGILLGILNIIYLQPIMVLNSYFLHFEGLTIIGLSLYSFFVRLLRSDGLKLHRMVHFWFPVIFCFFWSITFLNWGLYGYFLVNSKSWLPLINFLILLASIITNLAIAVVFWKYPDHQTAHG